MKEDSARNTFFVDEQFRLVSDILDQIIPRQGEIPGAGELDIAAFLDRVVGESPKMRSLFLRGLVVVELSADRRFQKGFTGLTDEEKIAVLKEVEAAEREFFDTLVWQTYNGYYTHPKVMSRLGSDARPPQPRGFPLEKGDLSGLEKVKRRGSIYREV